MCVCRWMHWKHKFAMSFWKHKLAKWQTYGLSLMRDLSQSWMFNKYGLVIHGK